MKTKELSRPTPGSPKDAQGLEFGHSWKSSGGFLVKLLLMGVINALGLFVIYTAFGLKSWVILGAAALLLIAADIIYFSKGLVPLKYLYPGLVFLFVFQVFVFLYTGYAAFTNYGFRHMGNQEQAVNAAMIQAERRVEGSATYPSQLSETETFLALQLCVMTRSGWAPPTNRSTRSMAQPSVMERSRPSRDGR